MVEELKRVDPVCNLCNFNPSRFAHYARLGVSQQLPNYTVAKTDKFHVVPDLFPINPDGRHMLIYPKGHVFNHAGLVTHVEELGRLVYNLEARFGQLVFFEHGGLQPGNSAQSIYHAHVHAIGGLEGIDVIRYMEDMLAGGLGPDEVYSHQITPAPDYAFLHNLAKVFNDQPYLYVEQGGWAIVAYDQNGKFRSQITQRAMHKFFSGEVLDWKKTPENEQFARESVRRIMNLIDFCEHGIYNANQF